MSKVDGLLESFIEIANQVGENSLYFDQTKKLMTKVDITRQISEHYRKKKAWRKERFSFQAKMEELKKKASEAVISNLLLESLKNRTIENEKRWSRSLLAWPLGKCYTGTRG
ncbi:hypothetical protein RJT34_09919 [Clitoria ternatea]|uniref:Uncharacterized protein n=1 Tax=Clitoria ternatea TaxID=43366 RepID=A0AAN9K8S5_CLITE